MHYGQRPSAAHLDVATRRILLGPAITDVLPLDSSRVSVYAVNAEGLVPIVLGYDRDLAGGVGIRLGPGETWGVVMPGDPLLPSLPLWGVCPSGAGWVYVVTVHLIGRFAGQWGRYYGSGASGFPNPEFRYSRFREGTHS